MYEFSGLGHTIESRLTGTVFKILDTRQSEILIEFSRNIPFNSPKNSRSLLRNLQRFQTKRFLNKDRLFLGELNGIFRENSMRISDCRVSSILKTMPVSRDSIVCPSPENSYITKRKHHLESLGISEQRSNTLERFQ